MWEGGREVWERREIREGVWVCVREGKCTCMCEGVNKVCVCVRVCLCVCVRCVCVREYM